MSARTRSAGDPAHLVDPLIVAWGAITALGTALLLYLPTALSGVAYGAAFGPLHAAAAGVHAGGGPYPVAGVGYAGAPLLPVVLSPLGGVAIEFAWIITGALGLALWTVASFLLVREAGVRDRGTARLLSLAVALLPWLFAPAAGSLLDGGTALYAGLAAAALLLALDAGRGATAGICLGITAALHPAAFLLVVYLAGRRDLRTIVYAAAAAAVVIGASSFIPAVGSAWGAFPGMAVETLNMSASVPGDRSLAGELIAAGIVPTGLETAVRIAVIAIAAVAALLLGAGTPLWVGGPIVLLLGALALPATGDAAVAPLLATGILLMLWTPMPGFLDRLLRPATWVILLAGGWCAAIATAGAGPWFWAAVAAPYLVMAVAARSPRTP